MNATDQPSRPDTTLPEKVGSSTDLPDYAANLRAFHQAFERELHAAAEAVPLMPDSRVLDVPCGDGFYTTALARRLGPNGAIVAADNSDAYLTAARRALARTPHVAAVKVVKADAYRLPFGNDSFDVVWCAQSFISLDDPVAVLKELRRVLRTNGTAAVLEDDEFHRVVVNWSVNLELAVQQAVAEATRAAYGSRAGLSPARRMSRFLLDAGFRPSRKQTFAADRQGPFGPAVRAYLTSHLRQTREYIARFLTEDQLAAFDQSTDPHDEKSILCRADAELTCLTTLFLAQK